MAYSAKIIADSISPSGCRLSTFEVTFPRFVLAEYNTHRMFSRNSASSRAIPVEKQLKKLEEDPFIPIYWGKNQKGMVAETELDELSIGLATKEWIAARDSALKHTRNLMEIGVHKQIANRLLEPFMWQTVICTATDWDNFFALRAHPDAQPEIRRIAEMMLQLLKTWQPSPIKIGEWHLPLVSLAEVDEFSKLGLDLKKISAGRCARVSYLTHDGKRDPLADIQLAERLQASGHMSPFEHVATPITETDALAHVVSQIKLDESCGDIEPDVSNLFLGNFRGWKQYRKTIVNEDNYAKVVTV